jgi:hypothetical protein
MDNTFRILGTDGPDITVRTSWLGSIKVLKLTGSVRGAFR